MLKVALLAPIPMDYQNVTSGVPMASLSLARAIKKYCFDVEITIVSINNDQKKIKYRQTDFARIFSIPTFRNRIVLLYLPDIYRIRSFLEILNPDVVHSQGFPEYILAGQFSGIPHVATLHGIIAREAKTEFRPLKHFIRAIIRGQLERYYVGRLKDIISISNYVRRYTSCITPARIHDIDNVIDERFFEMEDKHIPGFILLVGSVVYRKGAHVLIDAVGRLRNTKVVPMIHIVGSIQDFNYLQLLQEMIHKRKLQDNFFFHDSVSNEKLDEFYTKADIVCLPSLEETSPLSIAQAMAIGKKIVASNCGGIPDLLKNGETGFLFPAGSSEYLSVILSDIFNGKLSTDGLCQRAKIEAMNRFHPQVVAKKTRDVYYLLAER